MAHDCNPGGGEDDSEALLGVVPEEGTSAGVPEPEQEHPAEEEAKEKKTTGQ